MLRLSLHAPPSSQLPGSNLEVLPTCFPTMPDPTKCGWIDDDGKLASHWLRSLPQLDADLELLACKCVRSCKLSTSTRMTNGLACIYMCKLQSCSNQKQKEDEVTSSNSVNQTMI